MASITLIRDEEKIILVDTGLGTDINGRTDLIKRINKINFNLKKYIRINEIEYCSTAHKLCYNNSRPRGSCWKY